MKFWLALFALTSATADVAFRWPDGVVSTFATLIFWYLLFIMAAVVAMKIADRRWRGASGDTAES
jgi:cobalamin synthase